MMTLTALLLMTQLKAQPVTIVRPYVRNGIYVRPHLRAKPVTLKMVKGLK